MKRLIDLETQFQELAAEWRRIISPPTTVDEGRFAAVKAEADDIVARGRWTSGPADLLTVLGRHRDELFHSRVLGWLLAPTGRHGLGHRFLQALCREVWPDEELVGSGLVTVELEVTRAGVSGAGELLESRADIVVHTESLALVIENKLDAGEQPGQCERQYWAWSQDPIDTRFIFLTPGGRHPATAASAAALAAWRTLSYAQVHHALELSAKDVGDGGTDTGRATAAQYLATLGTL